MEQGTLVVEESTLVGEQGTLVVGEQGILVVEVSAQEGMVPFFHS